MIQKEKAKIKNNVPVLLLFHVYLKDIYVEVRRRRVLLSLTFK